MGWQFTRMSSKDGKITKDYEVFECDECHHFYTQPERRGISLLKMTYCPEHKRPVKQRTPKPKPVVYVNLVCDQCGVNFVRDTRKGLVASRGTYCTPSCRNKYYADQNRALRHLAKGIGDGAIDYGPNW